MDGNAPLAKNWGARFRASVGFTNPARGCFVQIEQAFQSVSADHLNGRIGAHRGSLEHLGDDLARHVRVNDIAAIRVSADREGLLFVSADDLVALAQERTERRLVTVQIRRAELLNTGALGARNHVCPVHCLGVEVDLVAMLIGHGAVLALDRQLELVEACLLGVHFLFDLGDLFVQQRVCRAFRFDLLDALIVGFLESLKAALHAVNGLGQLFCVKVTHWKISFS